MAGSRTECVGAARKLLRSFSSAPDARRRAQEIFQVLARGKGLTAAEHAQIVAFGQWLHDTPSAVELKPRCEALMSNFK